MLKFSAAAALACATALPLAAFAQTPAAKVPAPMPVTASFSILADLTRVVGGERVEVQTLVAANQDAHVFEPSPVDAKKLLQARVLVSNGLGFEPWLGKLVKAVSYSGIQAVASKGVKAMAAEGDDHEHGHGHDHGESDPHAWQDPTNVITYVRNISAALSQADPTGAPVYQANSAAYITQLRAFDTWAQAQFAALPEAKRRVITSHDAFGYFAKHYKLRFRAPQGISSEAEASAKDVAALVRQIKREKTKAVFFENMSNPKLITQLAAEAGVKLGPALYADALSAPGQPGATYLEMMRYNVNTLVAGMQQN
ncbi:metal ABC transporter solute-binding protein, Zn/Mn family [Variovorax sp. HJSM1_2]|uniref:metal ABC transporter solute-binding protein, Zn/Mn family n=1 Tax=Variovorax sp. HJSM1_2 TaxID=3366263 RepID=UPI003BD57B34